ncbi:hypothetical protein VTN77DRAFT_3731 [Rasamsonia byssochlamydoides]|uniref:uncharacterized protein n=1 Tax=Rasamsonia byssochlamydoides TaxID=89139 RepID=UPI003744020A
MDFVKSILECLTGCAHERSDDRWGAEKTAIPNNNFTKCSSSEEEIANSVLSTILTADEVDAYTVGEYGWTESIATAILDRLEEAIQQGIISLSITTTTTSTAIGPAIKEAFAKATEAAVGFAREHPIYCTIIALGILVLLSLRLWGLTRYAGYVPRGSLFSYFQRLGMVWKH